jgi:methylenetetrahydrofolate reductase (NADPH)
MFKKSGHSRFPARAQFIQTQCIFNLEKFAKFMKGVRDRGLHEQTYILAGITPLKIATMAEYIAAKVAGMDVPAAIIERLKGVEKKKQKQEGIKIAVETIQKLKQIKGVKGVHIMAIEWEDAVPEIVLQAGLLPKK